MVEMRCRQSSPPMLCATKLTPTPFGSFSLRNVCICSARSLTEPVLQNLARFTCIRKGQADVPFDTDDDDLDSHSIPQHFENRSPIVKLERGKQWDRSGAGEAIQPCPKSALSFALTHHDREQRFPAGASLRPVPAASHHSSTGRSRSVRAVALDPDEGFLVELMVRRLVYRGETHPWTELPRQTRVGLSSAQRWCEDEDWPALYPFEAQRSWKERRAISGGRSAPSGGNGRGRELCSC